MATEDECVLRFLGSGVLSLSVYVEYLNFFVVQVNPHEFYSACKRRRALKEAFRFSRLVGRKSLRNYNMLLSVCAQSQDASGKKNSCSQMPSKYYDHAALKACCDSFQLMVLADRLMT